MSGFKLPATLTRDVSMTTFKEQERGQKLEQLTDLALDNVFETLTAEAPEGDAGAKQTLQKRKDKFTELVLTLQRQVDSEALGTRVTDRLEGILAKLRESDPKPDMKTVNPVTLPN